MTPKAYGGCPFLLSMWAKSCFSAMISFHRKEEARSGELTYQEPRHFLRGFPSCIVEKGMPLSSLILRLIYLRRR